MKDDNERVEALNAIFDDDPAKKAREKEIEKLEKKREKQLAKLKKKGIDPEQKKEETETIPSEQAETEEKNEAASDVVNEAGETVTNYFADSDGILQYSCTGGRRTVEKKEEKRQEKEETGERRDQYRKRFNQSRFIYSGDRCSMLVDPYICWTAYRGERRLHE